MYKKLSVLTKIPGKPLLSGRETVLEEDGRPDARGKKSRGLRGGGHL